MERKINRMRLPIALAVVLAMIFTMGAAPTFAAAPTKDDVNYLGKGKVEVEFDDEVDYKRVKVSVRDTSRKKYKASIYRKNDDELRFRVRGYKAGKTYRFTISGVREEGTRKYGKVSGKFKIKKTVKSVKVEDTNYLGKGKVEVEFDDEVDYKRVKVSVRDTSGRKYRASIYKKNNDELRFRVRGYKTGRTYRYTISGIKEEDQRSYRTAKGVFKIKKVSKSISAAQARNIAFRNAGVSASQVYDLDVDGDRDHGVTKYEISFKAKGYDYDYEISLSGKILKKDRERDD